jgi:hypothetical protein
MNHPGSNTPANADQTNKLEPTSGQSPTAVQGCTNISVFLAEEDDFLTTAPFTSRSRALSNVKASSTKKISVPSGVRPSRKKTPKKRPKISPWRKRIR